MITRRSVLTAAGSGSLAAAALTVGAAPSDAIDRGPGEMPHLLCLLALKNADGSETLGLKTEMGVIDVRQAAAALALPAPLTLDQALQQGRCGELNRLAAAVKSAGKGKAVLLNEADITHGRLFTAPGKIICVGLNYRRHAQEVGMAYPKAPILFNKYNNSLAGQNCVITLPPKEIAYKFDYETELLIVIGKAARNVTEADALDYVAGYCTANDFSARDLQIETGGQWMIGKTLDNFAPIGPYFVSADQVGDPNNLTLQTTVNGEIRQNWSTNDFIFNSQQMIAYISRHWTLEPGDIIFTGTPQGVILGYPKDQQVWLKAGDRVVSTIEKLGSLSFSLA